jgi:hypothetical protein
MRQLHPFIYEYNFPYHDFLLKNYDFFDKIYSENIEKIRKNGGANVTFRDEIVYPFLFPKLRKLIDENFYLTPTFQYLNIGIYKQTHVESTNVSHCHILTHSVSTVFYLNPPKEGEGGEIIFHDLVYDDTIKLQPKPNKLYVFPGWLYHTPLPQTSIIPRFSFNWGYDSHTRPIHKITGDRW